jgi:transcriptional regulator with XRE-family HTH domain
MKTLGERIRELRVNSGRSQRDLATAVGVSFPHISKIEKGTEVPSASLLERIAEQLDVDATDELFVLANRVPDDVAGLVVEKADLATMFLRRWKNGDITDDEVRRLVDKSRP